MRTRMAPAYANIFMADFENKHLPNALIQQIIWKRYIDGILAIFVCDTNQLTQFESWINSMHPTIKFTRNCNPEEVPFLDTFLSIRNNKISLRPYMKSTDTKQ